MTDLTKASEADMFRAALVSDLARFNYPNTDAFVAVLDLYAEAVRSDTLADVAARLPEALDSLPYRDAEMWANDDMPTADFAAAILAHLGGTR